MTDNHTDRPICPMCRGRTLEILDQVEGAATRSLSQILMPKCWCKSCGLSFRLTVPEIYFFKLLRRFGLYRPRSRSAEFADLLDENSSSAHSQAAQSFTPVPALKSKEQTAEVKEPFFLDIRTPGFALHLDIKFSKRLWASRLLRALVGTWQRITFKDLEDHVTKINQVYEIERVEVATMNEAASESAPKLSSAQEDFEDSSEPTPNQ